jgi:uncharacterized membrane protein YdfJ with MMPL/SSD domain
MKKTVMYADTIAKAIVGSGALIITALQPIYGGDTSFVAAVAVYGALSIYFTKNLGTSIVTVDSSQETHQ